MANAHSTLASLFADIAKAIRSKTGSSASIVADNFPTAISSIEVKENLDSELSTQDSLISQINSALVGKVGVALPVLSNPAGAGNIEAAYQAIDGSGNLMNGTMVKQEVKTVEVSTTDPSSLTVPGLSSSKNFVLVFVGDSTNYAFGYSQFIWLSRIGGVLSGAHYRGSGNSFTNEVSTVSIAGDKITFSQGFVTGTWAKYAVTMW